MDKDIKYFGIDISAIVFDVMDSDNNYYQFSNNHKGFKKFLKILDQNSLCIMESTGYYHSQLAYYLVENTIDVSVVNPLSIKRFIQMHLSKIKTDKADAKMICLYGQKVDVKLWKGATTTERQARQIMSLLDSYLKKTTSLKNKMKGEKVLGNPCKLVVKSLKKSLKYFQKEIELLEEKLEFLVKIEHKSLLTRIMSIKGIGKKTAISLIVITDGFEKFNNSSQLCSYAGTTPITRISGSSIRGKARISKMGNRNIRKLLFMCSFTACKHNKACREIYERIINKGKSKKLALIAVCNKLLKQSFAIAKSGLVYDENYKSVLKVQD